MLDFVKGVLDSAGYYGLAFLMFLENVFPPIPSELIMPLAGFVVTRGELTFVGCVIAGMVGSTLGALPLYYLGRVVGEERLKNWFDKHGEWLATSGEDIDKA